MNGFYPRQRYNNDGSVDTSQQPQYGAPSQQQHGNDPGGGHPGMMDMGIMTSIPGAVSLDDIVNQNAKDFRRRSMPVPNYNQIPSAPQNVAQNDIDTSMRRASMVDMMDFGNGQGDMANFNFDASGFDTSMLDMNAHANTGATNRVNNLSVTTRFPGAGAFGGMNPQSAGAFDSAMSGGNGFETDLNSPYLTSAFPTVSMGNDMSMMRPEMPTGANIFNTEQFNTSMANSPIQPSYTPSMLGSQMQDPGTDTGSGRTSRTPNTQPSGTPSNLRQSATRTNSGNDSQGNDSASTQPPQLTQTTTSGSFSPKRRAVNPPGQPQMINGNVLPWTAPPDGWPSSMAGKTHMSTQFKDAYAPSGYDLMSILVSLT